MTPDQGKFLPEPPISPEVDFNRRIAGVTTTRYPNFINLNKRTMTSIDDIRGDLALKSITSAIENGFQYIVVEGQSSGAFRNEMELRGIHYVLEAERGMSAGRQQGFQIASGLGNVAAIGWFEPEKLDFVSRGLLIAARPVVEGTADVVIPARTEDSFATYPDYQGEAERKANQVWNKILRAKGILHENEPDQDPWFGPRVIANKPDLIEIFTRRYSYSYPESTEGAKLPRIAASIDPNLWPNATFLPIIEAMRLGYQVVSVEVPYRHPDLQTQSELNNPAMEAKRRVQYENIIGSMSQYLRLIEGSPRTTHLARV